MTTRALLTPDATEYAPYYGRYVSLVPKNDIVDLLEAQAVHAKDILSGISERDGNMRYAPGKWTIKQLFGHVIDTERIFAYRALRISRGDQTPIEGFEQDPYVQNGPFEACTLAGLTEEYTAVRRSTLFLFRHLKDEHWSRRGTASGNEVSVRALAYIIAGHELHHWNVLREKYLTALAQHGG